MGKLVMRYRLVMVAFPLLIVAMVLRKQFKIFDENGKSIHTLKRAEIDDAQAASFPLPKHWIFVSARRCPSFY